jgi:polyphosphate kinase 2
MKTKKDEKDAPAEQAAGNDDAKKHDKAKKGKKDKKGKKAKRTPDQVSAAVSVADGDAVVAAEAAPLKGKAYDKELARLHAKLVKLQEWVKYKGLKVCIVFEGRDGAGKGGAIKAITERVSPRVFRVVALPAPTERQKSQMYMQRYVQQLPAAGEVVIFDRSWYNRAGVERVMGFCSEEQARKFLAGVPLVEKAMVDAGIILIKFWLEVSEEEQARRLESRLDDARKTWKLTGMDLKSYSRWYDYSRARDEMFVATDTDFAPWHVVRSDDKKRARLNVISHILDQVPHHHAPREKVKLPKRQKPGGYKDPDYPYKYVRETY